MIAQSGHTATCRVYLKWLSSTHSHLSINRPINNAKMIHNNMDDNIEEIAIGEKVVPYIKILISVGREFHRLDPTYETVLDPKPLAGGGW